MFDYIYYNPISNPMRSSSESSATKEKEKQSVLDGDLGNSLAEEQVDDPGEGGSLLVEGQSNEKTQVSNDKDVEAEADDGGMPAPRVKVGPDGELILDEQSLVIETTGLKEGLQDLAKGPALVESSSFTNYATYSKRTKGHEWSENETLRFYRALNVVGTDFTLMQSLLFTSRSRRDLKNKFKREERRNPSLIERALLNPGVFSNVEELQTEFAKTDPPEKDKAESKRGRGRGKSRGGKRAAQKDGRPPAKKKKRKNWLVNGNESHGEESDAEDNVSVASDHKKELDFPVEKNRESTHLPPPPDDVVYNVSSEEVMMGSQEIVITNVDSPTGSSVKEASQRGCCESENGFDDDSDDAESVSSESQFLSRVLQPTRSGRVPKRREVDNGYQNSHKKAVAELGNQKQVTRKVNVKVSDSKSQPLRPDMKTEVIVCSKEPEERSSMEDSRQPVAIELTECSSNPTLSMDRISGMDPGSLVVIATSAPDDPSRKVYQVFMVSPRVEGQDSLLIPQSFSAEIKPEMFGEEVSAPVVPVENAAGDCTGAGSVEFPPEGLESCSADGVMKPNLHEET